MRFPSHFNDLKADLGTSFFICLNPVHWQIRKNSVNCLSMKALLLILLLSFGSQAQTFYCVLKTKADRQQLAPTLVQPRPISDGILTQYLVQTHNLATILGFEADRIDTKKPYRLDLVASQGGRTEYIRLSLTKGHGLAVIISDEYAGQRAKYEFIEAKSSPATISVTHRNGWSTEIGCLPN